MFYDYMILGSIEFMKNFDFWDKVKDWKKCMWDIGFAGPWEYWVWTRSQRCLGKFCFFLPQDCIFTPAGKRTWSIWQCQSEAKWEVIKHLSWWLCSFSGWESNVTAGEQNLWLKIKISGSSQWSPVKKYFLSHSATSGTQQCFGNYPFKSLHVGCFGRPL